MEENCCRICLSPTQLDGRQDLFLEEQHDLSEIGQVYEEVLNISITNIKILLRYICNSCDLQLKLFKQLKNKALDTHLLLNDILVSNHSKDECLVENEDNNPIVEQIDYSDNEQQEENEIEPEPGVEIYEQVKEEDLISVNGSTQTEEQGFDISDNEYEICYLDEENVDENEINLNKPECEEECHVFEDDMIENNTTPSLVESDDDEASPFKNETFKLKSKSKSQKKKTHRKTSKIKCPHCEKILFSEENYQAHMNIHNGLPAYQCNICEKAFNQKVHYNYHMLNHNNERNIICDVCQKGFISKSDLKTHMRVHTDERPYNCDICKKSFRAHTHMINHRYSHFEKQFECPECFQKYVSPNTLRTHFRAVHKGEVPFECKFCEKRFKRKHHLQAHYKTHAKLIESIDVVN